MASRFPLIADSSSNSLKEIPSGDHIVFDAAAGNITTLTDGASIGIDFSDGNNFKVTLAGNRTLSNPTNVVAGQSGFIAVSPPADKFDFAFLAPCPASGLIVHGENNKRVPIEAIHKIVDKISIQKGIKIDVEYIKEANHMFSNHDQELMEIIRKYLNNALDSSEYLEI